MSNAQMMASEWKTRSPYGIHRLHEGEIRLSNMFEHLSERENRLSKPFRRSSAGMSRCRSSLVMSHITSYRTTAGRATPRYISSTASARFCGRKINH